MSVIKVHTNATRMLIVPTGKDRTIVRVEMGTTEMASTVQVTENLLYLLNLDSIHLCDDITTSYNITLPIHYLPILTLPTLPIFTLPIFTLRIPFRWVARFGSINYFVDNLYNTFSLRC